MHFLFVSVEDDDEVSIFQRDPTLYPKKYKELLEESVALDVKLFHTLFTIVKGTYLNLITDLTGKYGRYTFAHDVETHQFAIV